MMKRVHRSGGFSLVEILVVIAIIGVMSLIGVPAFMNYQKSQAFKTSMRQFTSDMRAARQRAVTRTSMVRITNIANVGPEIDKRGVYQIQESTDRGTTWTTLPRGEKQLEKRSFFPTTGGTITFLSNGTVQLPAGVYSTSIDIKSKDSLPKDTYTVSVTVAGKVSAN